MNTPRRHVDLPDAVRAFATRGPDWASYVAALPGVVAGLLEEWELVPDGPAMHGYASVVVPVRHEQDRAVLKVAFPDDESEHEALALQHWHGRGAVALLRADPRRRALLLERLHPTDLSDHGDIEACEIVGGLYVHLHRPALPQLRTLTSYVERWGAALGSLPRSAPLPRRLVEQAVSLGRDLVADPAGVDRVLHGDLHFANVLAADRAPWLAIDPKPMNGDPHYEVAPLLWNRFDELAGDIRGGVRRRFHATIDAAGLDEDRARDWVVVRMLHNALWAIQDGDPDPTWLTTCVAIAKAVQE
ncbi:streptomycin 6-kinase [Nocardioides psychrotolerans]|uniref:Streptomycin 6-kinase n=1 Tax=Nocardioides psychrotolerans TaxID=1005945 RepID=A0A1I3F6L7_9ACTN|nr:aminoglycoside phosphotransferase family protein [Nocardioides psychrotolerans]GEP37829.1 streptomycin 6-kinase [Nocardioides psychrotolerans]SFI06848.1 streptomycin 6-kinase [Nocardioides psychrotolerans]